MSKSMGLRTEILITLVFLLGAALLLGGAFMLRIVEKNLLEQQINQLELVSVLSAQGVVDFVQPGVSSLLYRLDNHYQGVSWWLYDSDLRLQASSVSDKISSVPPDTRHVFQVKVSSRSQRTVVFPSSLTNFSTYSDYVRFILPVKEKKQVSGVLVFDYSLQKIRGKLVDLQKLLLLYVFLYGVVLVGAGYFLLERNIIRPARALLRATQNVRLGDLGTRLPEFGPTEITNLSASYNQMVEALVESRQETEQHIKSLEATNIELRQMQEQLIQSEKMASVGELAAGLAHELGNPLAALIGYLELLKSQISQADQWDILKRSLIEAERIDFLVRELLNFSRPATRLAPEKINLNLELDYCVDLLQHQGSLVDIEVVSNYSASLPDVVCCRERLRQVFINILLNAVQACESSGLIALETDFNRLSVVIKIKDNGCGMTANVLNKIFDPFFTTKPSGKGTGLGLSICQRIIAEEGGHISVQSSPGKGSCFLLELPISS